MEFNSFDSGQYFFIELADVFVMGDVVIGNGHLATADSGAYV